MFFHVRWFHVTDEGGGKVFSIPFYRRFRIVSGESQIERAAAIGFRNPT
jgi:hypothetical protein